MRILITGMAGFIGYHLAKELVKDDENYIVGVDNLNNYYSIELKYDRLKQLGFKDLENNDRIISHNSDKLFFEKMNISDRERLLSLFEN